MKPLLIGQAPGPNTDPAVPLVPWPGDSAGARLAALAGFDPQTFLETFDRINLLQTFPGRGKRDDKFPRRDARIAAAAIRPLLAHRHVILVGRNVAQAFGFEQFSYHEWFNYGFPVAVVPHPSGRNHWYRKPGHEEIARDFWTRTRVLICRAPPLRAVG